jgi:hypothetical protein
MRPSPDVQRRDIRVVPRAIPDRFWRNFISKFCKRFSALHVVIYADGIARESIAENGVTWIDSWRVSVKWSGTLNMCRSRLPLRWSYSSQLRRRQRRSVRVRWLWRRCRGHFRGRQLQMHRRVGLHRGRHGRADGQRPRCRRRGHGRFAASQV